LKITEPLELLVVQAGTPKLGAPVIPIEVDIKDDETYIWLAWDDFGKMRVGSQNSLLRWMRCRGLCSVVHLPIYRINSL
jgi:hypothetical protein